MKGHYTWWKLIAFLAFLLPVIAGNAQSNLCRSSFSCKQASQSNVVINPAGTGAWSQLYNTGGFTWEAWFRLKTPIKNQSIIVSVEDAVVFQDIFLGFGWGSIPNALCFHVSDNGANNTVVNAESLQALTLNTWYHAAGVCDYANAVLKLYLNGSLIATQTLPPDLLANRLYQDHSAFIGNASASLSGSDMDIDELRFWNTARTDAEIQSNMTACLTLPQTGLVAWFKADESGAPIAKSAVDANFSATLQNAGYATPAPVDDCYTLNIDATAASCKTVDFSGSISSGITILDWSWDFGDGNTGDGQSITHSYANFGPAHVALAIKDNAGCGTTIYKDIDVAPAYVNDAQAVSICQGQSFMGHNASATFTATLPAADGCDTIRTYTLTVKNKPDLGDDKSVNVCDGSTIALTPLYNLSGYASVAWNIPDPDHAVPGRDSLFVSYTGGCSDTAVVLVVGLAKPELGADKALKVCQGVTTNLNTLYDTSPYAAASWDLPSPATAGAGDYTLVVTAANGCTDTARAVIVEIPKISTVMDTSFCVGGSYAGYSSSGDYTDKFTSTAGCDSIRTLHLTVFPKYSTVIDTSLCGGGSIEGYTQPGSYTDVFHSAGGCDSVRVLNISACDLFFPNAFTPNGDGKNDAFKALNAVNLKNFHLAVYNRWGQLVFETSNPGQGWDGTINAKPGPAGAYIWFCKYSIRGSVSPGRLKGTVFLIR